MIKCPATNNGTLYYPVPGIPGPRAEMKHISFEGNFRSGEA